MPVKTCEVCSLDFKARLNVVRTCSTQCRNTLISREKSLRHQAVKNCVVCNAEFQVGAVDAIKQTCSKACSYKLRGSKTSKGQMMTCVTCGAGVFYPVVAVEDQWRRDVLLQEVSVRQEQGQDAEGLCVLREDVYIAAQSGACANLLYRVWLRVVFWGAKTKLCWRHLQGGERGWNLHCKD